MISSKTASRPRAWRSRWAAIGAAVAVTLGASGLMVVNAASSAPSNFISVDPARILDTRTDVGLPGPFISGVAQRLQVTGPVPVQPAGAPATTNQVVPNGATGVVLNVTVIGPQTGGFLSIRPADATGAPAVSNINWAAGGANIANSVTVALPTSGTFAGKIEVFVDGFVKEVLVDVAGYYQPLAPGIDAKSNKKDDISEPNANQFGIAMSVVVEAETVGIIQIVGSALVLTSGSTGTFDCRITRGAGQTENNGTNNDLSDTDRRLHVGTNEVDFCSTNGTVAVGAGSHIINLVVRKNQTSSGFDDGTLQALFIPGGLLDNSDG